MSGFRLRQEGFYITGTLSLVPRDCKISPQKRVSVMSEFSLGQEGSFSTGTLNLEPRDCKSSPLKTGFRYIRVSFRAGGFLLVQVL